MLNFSNDDDIPEIKKYEAQKMDYELPQSDTPNWNDIFSEGFIGKVITDLFIFLE